MILRRPILFVLAMAAPWAAMAQSAAPPAEGVIRVELNALEGAGARCRLAFVVENRAGVAVESLKLDLAVFSREGAIQRRTLAELGPARRDKTLVRAFDLEGACEGIGAVLVNDVAACAPAGLGDCLDRLDLASRVAGVRLWK